MTEKTKYEILEDATEQLELYAVTLRHYRYNLLAKKVRSIIQELKHLSVELENEEYDFQYDSRWGG